MVKQNQKQDADHAIKSGKASIMPAKHILELVLDALQRRDTYEIFAEPVDPDEVEDYYEIIKEPMDFGTMRAKLHEGMYENLEQFEHDVFLIPENAMHFNSSATIYFRQMNQGEINYKDSLMSFVKGLGPIAEKVARGKLLPQIEPKSQISAAKERKSGTWDANAFRTFRDFAAGRCPNLKASNVIDLTEDGEEAKGRNKRVDYGSPGKEKSDCGRAGKEKIDSHRRVNAIGKQDGIARNRKSNEMGRSCAELNSSSGSRSNNTSLRDAAGKSDDNVRPVILALENTHSNAGESKLRNKKSCIKWSVGVKKGQTNELSGEGQKEGKKMMPSMSQFTFDLPFLKARLNEMNVGGGEVKRATSFEKGGGAERALNCTQQAESIVMKPFLSRPSSFNKLDTTNLALEL
ncbi:UNVERIFIED_CONTAM: hypothetical protein Sradi_3464600 [Sesamum radiatum]|uniref:Bromo domain-containing protein n=1 Tax=Sesamum radiatum TaxID=300843 RepID=A0AAW2R680_SESRA